MDILNPSWDFHFHYSSTFHTDLHWVYNHFFLLIFEFLSDVPISGVYIVFMYLIYFMFHYSIVIHVHAKKFIE